MNDSPTVGFDISGSFDIPLDWDILVAASDSYLAGYAPGFVEYEEIKKQVASITYRLRQTDLGELGIVEIRKLATTTTRIIISGVPMNSVDTAAMWLNIKPKWDEKINEAWKVGKKNQKIKAYSIVSNEISKVKQEIIARQKNHQANVIKAYFNRLLNDLTLWTCNKAMPPSYLISISGLSEWPDSRRLSKEGQEYFKNYKLQISQSNVEKVDVAKLREIVDPTDQRIWTYIQADPSITDRALAQKLGNLTRQAVNTRRRALEKMGYPVRKVSRQIN